MTPIENMINRRSCRSFKGEIPTHEEIEKVLEAGLWAPSGRNFQCTKFVAVTNPDTIAALSRMNAAVMGMENDPFYGAPCVIITFSDSNVHTYIEDGSLAMGNMLNAAAYLGLGSCWIHRAREVFETEDGKALMRQWGIPESYKGIGNCILGYENAPSIERPRVENRVVFAD